MARSCFHIPKLTITPPDGEERLVEAEDYESDDRHLIAQSKHAATIRQDLHLLIRHFYTTTTGHLHHLSRSRANNRHETKTRCFVDAATGHLAPPVALTTPQLPVEAVSAPDFKPASQHDTHRFRRPLIRFWLDAGVADLHLGHARYTLHDGMRFAADRLDGCYAVTVKDCKKAAEQQQTPVEVGVDNSGVEADVNPWAEELDGKTGDGTTKKEEEVQGQGKRGGREETESWFCTLRRRARQKRELEAALKAKLGLLPPIFEEQDEAVGSGLGVTVWGVVDA